MPSADFCAAIRRPFDLLSRQSDTAQTSRGKTNSLPHPPPNLRSAPLVDMDFVVDRPLVRRSRLISGSCSSVHAFAPRFLQTPPRDDALALRYPFTSTRLGRGLSPPSCRPCPAHDPSARAVPALGRDDIPTGLQSPARGHVISRRLPALATKPFTPAAADGSGQEEPTSVSLPERR